MNKKSILILTLLLAATAIVITWKTIGESTSPTGQASQTRASHRPDESPATQPKRERKQRPAATQAEHNQLLAHWGNNAAASMAISKKNLIADLNPTAEESAQLETIFSRRQAELNQLLHNDTADDRENLRKISALLRNHGLREDLAAILSPEKLATFDANQAAHHRDTIEARAYRDMAEINEVVSLTDTQKQQALAALLASAPEKIEHEADTRALMTLHYGQSLADIGSSDIRGFANLISASLHQPLPPPDKESPDYQQWTNDNKTRRIHSEIAALQSILSESQITRYRQHLEAEPAW